MKKTNILLIILSIFLITGCKLKTNNDKKLIIATNFPSYDAARAIIGDSDTIELKMLLKPGSDIHDFEPTPKDIKNIIDSSLFIYVGGESDEWIDDVLGDVNKDKTKLVKLMDLVDLKEEEIVDGMESDEEEEEYDEHIWTSPLNEIIIINYLKDEIIKIDPDNKDIYEKNASDYINQLKDIDNEFKDIVKNGKRKTIIFGDRFPLRYFVDLYDLDYYAAFPGCSEQTEASAKTISFLINKVKSENIPVVFKIELSNGKIADTIANETNAKVLEFHTAHNISLKDFNNGITYVDIMKKNIKALKEALN